MNDLWVRVLVGIFLAAWVFSALWLLVSYWKPHYRKIMEAVEDDQETDGC